MERNGDDEKVGEGRERSFENQQRSPYRLITSRNRDVHQKHITNYCFIGLTNLLCGLASSINFLIHHFTRVINESLKCSGMYRRHYYLKKTEPERCLYSAGRLRTEASSISTRNLFHGLILMTIFYYRNMQTMRDAALCVSLLLHTCTEESNTYLTLSVTKIGCYDY